MLEIRGLTAGYGRLMILREIEINVAPMSVVAVVGANGAGKTTLLRCISGLVPAQQGSIRWHGEEIAGMKPWRRVHAGIAHAPEGRQVFPNMTVEDHLVLAGEQAPVLESPFDIEYVYDLFPKLRARLDQQAGTLSGGEQQMLAIGRALMSRPRLLLLDEPSHGLAPIIVQQLSDLVARIAEHISILLVEQNLSLPERIADSAIVLQNGRVVSTGPATEILSGGYIKSIYLGAGG